MLFRQIENCQKFAAAGNVAITPAQVLKAAETLILQTGKYTSAYREWISLDPNSKTDQNFKTRMTREYQLQNQMTSTAHDAGYHANAAINESDEHSLASAAQDFAAASAADRSAFQQLTNTNGDLSTQVANMAVQNQQLQQQMSQLQQHMMFIATAPPPAPYTPQGCGGRTPSLSTMQPLPTTASTTHASTARHATASPPWCTTIPPSTSSIGAPRTATNSICSGLPSH